MQLSARNVLKGTIQNIDEGAVNGVVAIDMNGQTVKADITMDAIKSMGLKTGEQAYAVIKASSVMFAAGNERINNLSARNQIHGTIADIQQGAVNGIITLEIADGICIKGSITNEAINQLDFKAGEKALAVIKSTDVMVAID
ncbi:TOBE domain-containing protein [Adlercreutzia sp. ZJ304]|uniref:TOBE domain-containing protein n=1 Tax=Adlercreutzia sp. ZJ304 TaxID=2709791 RepID=UPI0013EB8013|nr:TOBE domain-containing protein [Adlercreutzia sp. ZJ304]